MQIDLKKLIDLSRDKNKRKELGKNNIDIRSNMYPFIKDYTSYIENLSTYELSSIIIDKKNWIASRSTLKSKTSWVYRPGDIVMVYLGSGNYGNELSYHHPAVILHNLFNSVLIIPCSSTISNGNYEIIGEISDGFLNKTSIQLNQIRIIDKKRILRNSKGGVVGSLSFTKLTEIRKKFLSTFLNDYEKKIEKLETDNKTLIEEKEKLVEEKEKLLEINERLKKELEDLRKI